MLYGYLKVIHIIGAAIIMAAMAYCYRLWQTMQDIQHNTQTFDRIQTITWLIIIPLALIQLMTGFTIISIRNEDFSQFWVSASSVGFIIVVGSWLAFMYLLVLSHQAVTSNENSSQLSHTRYRLLRRAQFVSLSVCAIALFCMIFFMANKIS